MAGLAAAEAHPALPIPDTHDTFFCDIASVVLTIVTLVFAEWVADAINGGF